MACGWAPMEMVRPALGAQRGRPFNKSLDVTDHQTRMSDEETKNLLREIVTLQKESLELARRSNEAYEEQLRASAESAAAERTTYQRQSEAYGEALTQYQQRASVFKLADVIRTVALVLIAVLLAYLSIVGIHTH